MYLLNSFFLFFIFSQISTGRVGLQLQQHCPEDAVVVVVVATLLRSLSPPQIDFGFYVRVVSFCGFLLFPHIVERVALYPVALHKGSSIIQ